MAKQSSQDSIENLHRKALRAEAAADRGAQARAATAPRPVRHYRALVFQGYVVAAILAFAILSAIAHSVAYFPIDLTITRAIQTFDAPWFAALMEAVSWPGRSPQAALAFGLPIVLLIIMGLRWEGVMTGFAAFSYPVTFLVKFFVNRPRPEQDLVRVFATHSVETSFPSGHVVTYVAVFGFLWFLCYVLFKHGWQRTLLLFLFGALVVLIGPSRVDLGEHWTSDVIGAYLLGSLWLALTIYVYRWGKPRFFVDQPTAPSETSRARAR